MIDEIEFFNEMTEKSRVKVQIVKSFYGAYINIIKNAMQHAECFYYVDLFAGAGAYDDGNESVPLLIMNEIVKAGVQGKTHIILNDNNPKIFAKLKANVTSHPNYSSFKNKPLIYNLSASQIDLKSLKYTSCPIFSFIDPFGYKDVTAEKVFDLIKNEGSDSIVFFNVARIYTDLSKKEAEDNLKGLFGIDLSLLIENVKKASNENEKFKILYKSFAKQVRQQTHKNCYVLPFKFYFDDRERVSHYLLFFSKNITALQLMKSIMIKQTNQQISMDFSYDNKKEGQISFDFLSVQNELNKYKLIKEYIRKYIPKQQYMLKKFIIEFENAYLKNNNESSLLTTDDYKVILRKLAQEGIIKTQLPFSGRETKFSDKREFELI